MKIVLKCALNFTHVIESHTLASFQQGDSRFGTIADFQFPCSFFLLYVGHPLGESVYESHMIWITYLLRGDSKYKQLVTFDLLSVDKFPRIVSDEEKYFSVKFFC